MQTPICADTLISRPPKRKLIRISENRFISPNNRNTKAQDKDKLLKMIELKPNEKLSAAKYNDNNKLMREFNEKWKKPKNTNQTLQEALFDVYIERNIKPKKTIIDDKL